ncbi:MAG: FAD-dependent oxidoreductase [Mycobacteriales bacterium]
MRTADVVVVGAGPAGMHSALAAARTARDVVLIDSGPAVGGQYYRHPADGSSLHIGAPIDRRHDTLVRLRAELEASTAVTVLPSTTVWHAAAADVGAVLHLAPVGGGQTSSLQARAVVLAPGAYDLALPIPGWTLPGVMTAGGAQAMLKGHGALLGRNVVVAGTGPFLVSVAAALAGAGATVAGVFEANRPTRWARHLPAVAVSPDKLLEGARLARLLRRHRVPVHFGHVVTQVLGTDAVEAVVVERSDHRGSNRSSSAREIAVDAVCLGWGFLPQVELAVALGCDTHLDRSGLAVVVRVDGDQRTSRPGVFAAGEITGIGGADLSAVEGRIAGLAAAASLQGTPPVVRRVTRAERARRRHFAAALSDAYPLPRDWTSWLHSDTVVCRCEEVPRASIDESIHRLGASDVASVKSLCRTGMGYCQGRMCDFAVRTIVTAATGRPASHRDALVYRPIAVPISIAALAAGDAEET